MKENDSTVKAWNNCHPLRNNERLRGKEKPPTMPQKQDFLKLLTMKALKALALAPPDFYSKAAAGELAFVTCNPQFLCHSRISISFHKLN